MPVARGAHQPLCGLRVQAYNQSAETPWRDARLVVILLRTRMKGPGVRIARMPNIVLASKIVVHSPSHGQFICRHAWLYSLILFSVDVIETRQVRATTCQFERSGMS